MIGSIGHRSLTHLGGITMRTYDLYTFQKTVPVLVAWCLIAGSVEYSL